MTDAERKLWFALREGRIHGLKFRRQHGIGAHEIASIRLSELWSKSLRRAHAFPVAALLQIPPIPRPTSQPSAAS